MRMGAALQSKAVRCTHSTGTANAWGQQPRDGSRRGPVTTGNVVLPVCTPLGSLPKKTAFLQGTQKESYWIMGYGCHLGVDHLRSTGSQARITCLSRSDSDREEGAGLLDTWDWVEPRGISWHPLASCDYK